MKALLVYPKYPDTFWSFKHALKFISKKAVHPPLGLLTIASMLPDEWQKRLVDMNTANLTNKDIQWADYVFIGAMAIQKESVRETGARRQKLESWREDLFLPQSLKIILMLITWYSMKPRSPFIRF
jgi:hypothetical protein